MISLMDEESAISHALENRTGPASNQLRDTYGRRRKTDGARPVETISALRKWEEDLGVPLVERTREEKPDLTRAYASELTNSFE
jgi:hypothetical protein